MKALQVTVVAFFVCLLPVRTFAQQGKTPEVQFYENLLEELERFAPTQPPAQPMTAKQREIFKDAAGTISDVLKGGVQEKEKPRIDPGIAPGQQEKALEALLETFEVTFNRPAGWKEQGNNGQKGTYMFKREQGRGNVSPASIHMVTLPVMDGGKQSARQILESMTRGAGGTPLPGSRKLPVTQEKDGDYEIVISGTNGPVNSRVAVKTNGAYVATAFMHYHDKDDSYDKQFKDIVRSISFKDLTDPIASYTDPIEMSKLFFDALEFAGEMNGAADFAASAKIGSWMMWATRLGADGKNAVESVIDTFARGGDPYEMGDALHKFSESIAGFTGAGLGTGLGGKFGGPQGAFIGKGVGSHLGQGFINMFRFVIQTSSDVGGYLETKFRQWRKSR